MFPYEYLVAAALLTSPADIPQSPPPVGWADGLRTSLGDLAVQWELLDERELRYVLVDGLDFSMDLDLLRRRHAELADAPSVHDALRFPDRRGVTPLLDFNRQYRDCLLDRQSREPARWWELRGAVQETDYLYEVWDNLRDARCEFYYVTIRRQALKRLRELIGEEAYYAGRLPPHVPVWCFQEIR